MKRIHLLFSDNIIFNSIIPSEILFIMYFFTLTFYIFDNIARNKDTSIIIPIIVLLSFTMVNASLVTSLVTFGILFFMLLVFFLPKRTTYNKFFEEYNGSN